LNQKSFVFRSAKGKGKGKAKGKAIACTKYKERLVVRLEKSVKGKEMVWHAMENVRARASIKKNKTPQNNPIPHPLERGKGGRGRPEGGASN